jgi:hypothetical protein
MNLNPSFQQLFPRSMLLASLDDDTSCSVVCKCALLVGWWHRVQWPLAFLRRSPSGSAQFQQRPTRVVSGTGDLVIDIRHWRNHDLGDLLTEFGSASVTLAGSGIRDVLLEAALAANAEDIPTIIIADALEGGTAANLGHLRAGVAPLCLLKSVALFLPMEAFVSTIAFEA